MYYILACANKAWSQRQDLWQKLENCISRFSAWSSEACSHSWVKPTTRKMFRPLELHLNLVDTFEVDDVGMRTRSCFHQLTKEVETAGYQQSWEPRSALGATNLWPLSSSNLNLSLELEKGFLFLFLFFHPLAMSYAWAPPPNAFLGLSMFMGDVCVAFTAVSKCIGSAL